MNDKRYPYGNFYITFGIKQQTDSKIKSHHLISAYEKTFQSVLKACWPKMISQSNYLTFIYIGVDLGVKTRNHNHLCSSSSLSFHSTLHFCRKCSESFKFILHSDIAMHTKCYTLWQYMQYLYICFLVPLLCVSVHFLQPCQKRKLPTVVSGKRQKHQLHVPWKLTFSLLWQGAVVHVFLYVLLFSQLQRAPHPA